MSQLILFNKPFRVMSQFSALDDKATLARYIDIPAVYPAGRLDYDSEGLLLLTGDGNLQHRISHPKHKLEKTYWVQVEGDPNSAAREALRSGVQLNDGPTLPARVRLLDEPTLWAREPPIRIRQAIPTHWLEIIISEGRNRQVRRMTAAVGLPTLRLVRMAIGPWQLDDLQPGTWRALDVDAPVVRDLSGRATTPSRNPRGRSTAKKSPRATTGPTRRV
jgi:23S rRNA pseudouridine2457 synthase